MAAISIQLLLRFIERNSSVLGKDCCISIQLLLRFIGMFVVAAGPAIINFNTTLVKVHRGLMQDAKTSDKDFNTTLVKVHLRYYI